MAGGLGQSLLDGLELPADALLGGLDAVPDTLAAFNDVLEKNTALQCMEMVGGIRAVLQKTTNYRLGFAVLGEIPPAALESQALRAFIVESNRRGEVLFLPDLAALEARLAGG